MNSKWIVLVLLIPFFLQACVKEDTNPPQIEFNNFSPAVSSADICGNTSMRVLQLNSGGTLSFEALITDDVELSQLKIDIHANFECHGHAKTEDWSLIDISDLSGTQQTINKSYTLPANVTAGNYHLIIDVIDAAGNDADGVLFYDLKVLNNTDTVAPIINVSSPMAGSSLSQSKGSSINFMGTLSDNYSLGEGENGKLELNYIQESTGNKFNAKRFELPVSQGTSYNFNFDFTIPNTLVSGNYTLLLEARDGVNNAAEPVSFSVEVL